MLFCNSLVLVAYNLMSRSAVGLESDDISSIRDFRWNRHLLPLNGFKDSRHRKGKGLQCRLPPKCSVTIICWKASFLYLLSVWSVSCFFFLFFHYMLVKFGQLDGDCVLDLNAADWDLDFVWLGFFFFLFPQKQPFVKVSVTFLFHLKANTINMSYNALQVCYHI